MIGAFGNTNIHYQRFAKESMIDLSLKNSKVHKSSVIFLRASAAILCLSATTFLIMPELLADRVGFTHHSPNTWVEVTAFYGGLELGIALYLLWCTKSKYRARHALMMIFIVFFTIGLARFFGVIRFGFEGFGQPVAAGIEIGWALIAYWFAKKIRKAF